MVRVFVGRALRLVLAVALMVGSVSYVGIRAGWYDSPASAATVPTIYIPPNARFRGYTTKALTIQKGQKVRVVNNDSMLHTVTSNAKDSRGKPLFNVTVYGHSRTTLDTSKLAPGKFGFHCNIHPSMKGTLTVKGSGGGTTGSALSYDIPLRVPTTKTGAHVTIPVERSLVRVFAHGNRTPMWTYGGSYPGPTIVRPAGSDTRVTFVDKLPSSVGSLSVHLHGDHHSSADDGQPTTHLLAPGRSRTYDYPLTESGQSEPGAFFYYHDHRMLETGRNNWMGLQGMFIVSNPADPVNLPSGNYDVPLMVSDRSFTSTHALKNPFPAHPMMEMTGPHAPPGDATVGDHILVNGEFAPYFSVADRKYRLRILNASNFQSYDFALSDGQSFEQIGTGDSLLPHPVARKDILLGPSERADVVVDFSGHFGQKIVFKSIPRVNRPKNGIGTPSAPIMQFRVNQHAADTSTVPSNLLALPALGSHPIEKTWTINPVGHNSHGYYWQINGHMFNPNVSNYTVKRGTTERWKLVNKSSTTHYFHIHEEQWRVVSRDGHPPAPYERGLSDTWRLDPGHNVVVQGTFSDYLGRFMLHCHMLDHEDHGLMAQFTVVK